jgi:NADPH:quinone reductase-like Zn-dependent oxidoreductase
MKAAVIDAFGEVPRYTDLADPVLTEGETLIDVKACDGIGTTADGKLVGFGKIRSPYGAFAERTVAGFVIPLPNGMDAASAAAIPPSTLTSLLPLWKLPGKRGSTWWWTLYGDRKSTACRY